MSVLRLIQAPNTMAMRLELVVRLELIERDILKEMANMPSKVADKIIIIVQDFPIKRTAVEDVAPLYEK